MGHSLFSPRLSIHVGDGDIGDDLIFRSGHLVRQGTQSETAAADGKRVRLRSSSDHLSIDWYRFAVDLCRRDV